MGCILAQADEAGMKPAGKKNALESSARAFFK